MLSEDDETPFVFLEREYMQTHPRIESMRKNHLDTLQGLAKDLGAKTKGLVRVIGSRNPGGVYSDLGSGVETGDYEINID